MFSSDINLTFDNFEHVPVLSVPDCAGPDFRQPVRVSIVSVIYLYSAW